MGFGKERRTNDASRQIDTIHLLDWDEMFLFFFFLHVFVFGPSLVGACVLACLFVCVYAAYMTGCGDGSGLVVGGFALFFFRFPLFIISILYKYDDYPSKRKAHEFFVMSKFILLYYVVLLSMEEVGEREDSDLL